ncbi:hypothetical protein PNIG_a0771 [Pseudoalteromonas nigrifaciens]|uniref:Uncharacterized protein n=1 Tax=Pseudoalteromonas nigrifaciens TaxID=28109 RepID=A0AAC9XW72_9GAMM|nr:hypothetical protein PNIG_a0771 [Pseudoalteromonas nigrifaciens]
MVFNIDRKNTLSSNISPPYLFNVTLFTVINNSKKQFLTN